MRKTSAPFSAVNGTPQMLVFGPFAPGDVIEDVTFYLGTGNWAGTLSFFQIAMVADTTQPIASSDENLSGGVDLAFPQSSSYTLGVCAVPVKEFVQADKRYIAIRITEGAGTPSTGSVHVRVTPGRIGRKG